MRENEMPLPKRVNLETIKDNIGEATYNRILSMIMRGKAGEIHEINMMKSCLQLIMPRVQMIELLGVND